MRLPLIALLCVAGVPALAQITAPLGSQERTDQIIQQARGLSTDLLASLEDEAAENSKREPVVARLAEACANLFAKQRDETITNPLCYEVFLETGLPE